jgi:hypothetical protein
MCSESEQNGKEGRSVTLWNFRLDGLSEVTKSRFCMDIQHLNRDSKKYLRNIHVIMNISACGNVIWKTDVTEYMTGL